MASSVPIVPSILCGTGAYLIYCSFKSLSPIGGIKNILTGQSLNDAKLGGAPKAKKSSDGTTGPNAPGTNNGDLLPPLLPGQQPYKPSFPVVPSNLGGSDPGPSVSI